MHFQDRWARSPRTVGTSARPADQMEFGIPISSRRDLGVYAFRSHAVCSDKGYQIANVRVVSVARRVRRAYMPDNHRFGASAASKLTPMEGSKGPSFRFLARTYDTIVTRGNLTNKSEFRRKFGELHWVSTITLYNL